MKTEFKLLIVTELVVVMLYFSVLSYLIQIIQTSHAWARFIVFGEVVSKYDVIAERNLTCLDSDAERMMGVFLNAHSSFGVWLVLVAFFVFLGMAFKKWKALYEVFQYEKSGLRCAYRGLLGI